MKERLRHDLRAYVDEVAAEPLLQFKQDGIPFDGASVCLGVRIERLHNRPEPLRVIELYKMCQLMRDDMAHQLWREL